MKIEDKEILEKLKEISKNGHSRDTTFRLCLKIRPVLIYQTNILNECENTLQL